MRGDGLAEARSYFDRNGRDDLESLDLLRRVASCES